MFWTQMPQRRAMPCMAGAESVDSTPDQRSVSAVLENAGRRSEPPTRACHSHLSAFAKSTPLSSVRKGGSGNE